MEPPAIPRLAITEIADADVPETVALWQRCGLVRPWNDPAADIAFARRGDNSTVLVARTEGILVATVMVGHDGHRGWVYYVAVNPDYQSEGCGSAIMTAAETWLRARGISKVMLMVRPDNTRVQAFYESLGYDEQERVVFAKWLDGREGKA